MQWRTNNCFIQDILRGEQHLFQELVAHYSSHVHGVALKVAKHPRDAEDISQEVFLQMYCSLSQFQGQVKLSTWIYRISATTLLPSPNGSSISEFPLFITVL